MKVRCPHCHNPIEILVESSFDDVECPSCGSSFNLLKDSETVSYAPEKGQTISHFELLEKLGTGAFGTVWKARDTELDRVVAVKVPRKTELDEEETEKFLREARAAAQLHHPNIVSVHEVGRVESTVYIVADLVQGLTLSDWLSGQRLTPREAAMLCITLAQALHHAHEAGIIHRDLKPSNIMLDGDGQPHIMDFGLAKREAGEITITVEGQVIGTPAYMSPEQARGDSHDVDRRSDLYSLGVILFELLTNERPFRGNARMLLHQVIHDDAPNPRKLSAAVPRDLETICLKCLEKEPNRRFQSAAELADELQRFIHGEPILSRPVTQIERGWRWSKRNPVVATMSFAIISLLLFLLIAGPIVYVREAGLRKDAEDAVVVAESSRLQAERAKQLALGSERIARQTTYASHMKMAFDALDAGNVKSVLSLLERHRPRENEEDFRGFEWRYLWKRYYDSHRTLHSAGVRDIFVTSSGTDVWINDGVIWRYNLDERRASWMYTGPAPVLKFATSAAANELVATLNDGTILVWDIVNNEQKFAWKEVSKVYDLCMSADGRFFVVGFENKIAKVYETAMGKLLHELTGHVGPVWSVAYSPDGNWIATGSGTPPVADGSAFIWDAKTGQLRRELDGHTHLISSVEFSPDSKVLAVGTGIHDGGVHLWRIHDLKRVRILRGHKGGIKDIAFTVDGLRIATAGEDQSIRIWNIESNDPPKVINGHESSLNALAFTKDGKSLISSDQSHGAKIWSLEESNRTVVPHQTSLETADFSPDGTFVAMGGWHGMTVANMKSGEPILRTHEPRAKVDHLKFTAPHGIIVAGGGARGGFDLVERNGSVSHTLGSVALWNIQEKTHTSIYSDMQFAIQSLDVSPTNRFVAVKALYEPGIRIWDIAANAHKLTLETTVNDAYGVKFLHDDKTLVAVGPDGVLTFDTESWALKKRLPNEHRLHGGNPALSPDGQFLAINANRGEVCVLDTGTFQVVASFKGHNLPVRAIAFSEDGKTLATAAVDGRIVLWNVPSWQEMGVIENGYQNFKTLAFSPDGSWLLAGGGGVPGGEKSFWFGATEHRQELELSGHRHLVRKVALSPDGRILASASHDGSVKIWNTGDWSEIASLTDHAGIVTDIAFSPDGRRLASASYDWETESEPRGGLHLWDATTWNLIWRRPNEFALTAVVFTPDSHSLITGSRDGTRTPNVGELRIWDCSTQQSEPIASDIGVVYCLCCSPDGTKLGVGEGYYSPASGELSPGGYKVFSLGDSDKFQLLTKQQQDFCGVSSIRFSPDGKSLLTGCWDNTIRIWDVLTGECVEQLSEHVGAVKSIAFSHDDRHFATASSDRTVKYWDWPSRNLLTTLKGYGSELRTVIFTKDDQSIVVGGGRLAPDPKPIILRVTRLTPLELADAPGPSITSQIQQSSERRETVQLPNGDWVALFNGEDLTGWQIEGNGNWHVKDGLLVGTGPHTRLVSRESDFEDVAVRVEAKLDAGGNSGVHVRTTFGEGWRSGYEAQISNQSSQKTLTGGIYSWTTVKSQLVNDGDWFTLTFVADDRDLRVLVNGRETSKVRLPVNARRHGAIALQAANNNEVWIRKVEVLRISK